MQEVKEFFCAVLLRVGSGADASLAQLQTLLRVYAVRRLLTLDPYCIDGILWNREEMSPYIAVQLQPAIIVGTGWSE